MARLPKVIADLNHLNTSLKLPIETEPGDKAEDREKEGVAVIVYREGTADLMRRSFCNNGFPVIFVIFVIIYKTKQKSFYP